MPALAPYLDWPNLPTMMLDRARLWGSRPMLRHHQDGAWHSTSWRDFAQKTASCAAALRARGVSPGDRVLIVSENRPEFPVIDTAIMAVHAVSVPAYTTYTVDDFAHVLRDSGARAVFVSGKALTRRVLDAARQTGGLDLLITTQDPGETDGIAVLQWTDACAMPGDVNMLLAESTEISRDALACLIYTSGTGGAPKGVMLSHRALLSNCHGAYHLMKPLLSDGEVYLSFLPLSHSYEHTIGQFFFSTIGSEIVYARGTEHLVADMPAVRPTVMTSVPRILELVRTRTLQALAKQPAWKQRMFQMALDIGLKRQTGQRRNPLEWLADPVLDRMVRRQVRDRFGGRLKGIMSGGGRLDPDVGRFFLALGLPVMQGYGQTEAGPVISANPPGRIRIETVGPPLRGVELRFADDGEILVRGDLLMSGYWNNADATADAIRDGWLHTGDIGVQDKGGYLRITDRKRDIIKTSGGDMVSPARIEGLLMQQVEIAQAVLAGDARPHLVALIVPNPGYDDTAVTQAVDRVNKITTTTERIRRWHRADAFTIENRMLTTTQKIRRAAVLKAHDEEISALYR